MKEKTKLINLILSIKDENTLEYLCAYVEAIVEFEARNQSLSKLQSGLQNSTNGT